jgi:hypothetical protein
MLSGAGSAVAIKRLSARYSAWFLTGMQAAQVCVLPSLRSQLGFQRLDGGVTLGLGERAVPGQSGQPGLLGAL